MTTHIPTYVDVLAAKPFVGVSTCVGMLPTTSSLIRPVS